MSFLPPADAAPVHPSVLAEMRARGDTCGWSCPAGVGNVWENVSARAPGYGSGGAGGFYGPSQTAPGVGTVKVAALLVQFQDIKFSGDTTSVGDSIEIMLSRADTYYRAVSYNRLKLSYTVFDTVMVTSASNQSVFSGVTGNHKNLVTEVLGRVDTFVTFGAYDVVVVFHAGVAKQLTGTSTDLDAQFFGFSNTLTQFKDTQTNDTVTHAIIMAGFGRVQPTNGETVTMLGTFCHEFGHALGLPDLYSTALGSGGIGDWGLMGTGNFAGKPQGDSPAWMCAWSREFLGWADTKTLDTGQTITLTKAEADSTIYKIRVHPSFDTEYFLLEVREPSSSGLDATPGSGFGMLIWHIDNTMGSITNNTVNNLSVAAHRRVDLEEADGSDIGSSGSAFAGTASQPWPGSASKTSFGDNSNPSSRGYSDTVARFALKNMSFGASVRFTTDFTDVSVADDVIVKKPSACLIARALSPWPSAVSFVRAMRDAALGNAFGRKAVARYYVGNPKS